MLVASQDITKSTRLKQILKFEFHTKDLGPTQRTVGMEIIGISFINCNLQSFYDI